MAQLLVEASARYRLLEPGDTIQVGDEVLKDDQGTWDATYLASASGPGRFFIGREFRPQAFMPTRRRVYFGG